MDLTDQRSDRLGHGDFVHRLPEPPIFVRASGSFLEDSKGRRYLDAEGSNGSAGLGFDPTLLQEATDRARSLPLAPSFCETEIRLELAQRITSFIESATGCRGRVAFELGGAQGIELALKVARANSPKSQMVVFEGAYHGRSAYASQLSASRRYRSWAPGSPLSVVRLPYPDCEQCRFSQTRATCSFECVQYVQGLVSSELCGIVGDQPDVAAFIFEPILNAGGTVTPDANYIESAVTLFRDFGALIVADEVFTGLYRTGFPLGFQRYNFVPDIIVMSKGLTNGICALSAVWAREPYMSPEQFPPGTHSATFINSPFALATALTVLDRYDNWITKESDIADLEASLTEIIGNVVQSSVLARSGYAVGGVGRILLNKPIARQLATIATRIGESSPVDGVHGLIVGSTGMAANVIALTPPLTITKQDLGTLAKLLMMTFHRGETEQI